jgi:hypothetical protein
MVTSPFTDTLAVEVATLQAQHPILADALSRAHTLLTDGRLFPEDDGRRAMVRSSDGATWYAVNGQCPCKASAYRKEQRQHRWHTQEYRRQRCHPLPLFVLVWWNVRPPHPIDASRANIESSTARGGMPITTIATTR